MRGQHGGLNVGGAFQLLGLRLDSTSIDTSGSAHAHGAPSRLAKIRAIKVCQANLSASTQLSTFHRQAELFSWQPGRLVWPGTAQHVVSCGMMGDKGVPQTPACSM